MVTICGYVTGKMVTINQLMVMGSVGFVACLGAYHLFQNRLSDIIKKSKVYEEVTEEIRKNKNVTQLLGEPIQFKSCRFVRLEDCDKDANDKIKLLVSGPKSGGTVFFTTKQETPEKLIVKSINLQIGSDKSKLLVVK